VKKTFLLCALLTYAMAMHAVALGEVENQIFSQKCHDGFTYAPRYGRAPDIVFADMNGNGVGEEILGFQMYALGGVGHPRSFAYVFLEDGTQTIPLNEFLGGSILTDEGEFLHRIFDVIDLNNDGKQEVVIWSSGGFHYRNIIIVGEEGGRVVPLFMNGSACPIIYNPEKDINKIKIGRANWDDPDYGYTSPDHLWEVWEWNGQEFTYNEEESSSPALTETEEVERFLKSMMFGKRGPPGFFDETMTFDNEQERKEFEYTTVYGNRGLRPGFTEEHIKEIIAELKKYK
jgi:hypothetical protein